MNLDLLTPIQLRRARAINDFGSASPSAHHRGNPPGNVAPRAMAASGGALPMSLRVWFTSMAFNSSSKPQSHPRRSPTPVAEMVR
jgi:hypothetical protein